MTYAYDKFKRDRKDWVKELEYFNKKWDRRVKSRSNHWRRKEALLSLIQIRLTQLLETEISDTITGKCFPEKVRQLLGAIKIANEDAVLRAEVLKMVAPALGRLTFDGYSGNDTFAAKMDQTMIKLDVAWNKKTPNDGEVEDFRQAQLRSRWASLSVVCKDCNCLQCIKRRRRTTSLFTF